MVTSNTPSISRLFSWGSASSSWMLPWVWQICKMRSDCPRCIFSTIRGLHTFLAISRSYWSFFVSGINLLLLEYISRIRVSSFSSYNLISSSSTTSTSSSRICPSASGFTSISPWDSLTDTCGIWPSWAWDISISPENGSTSSIHCTGMFSSSVS